MQVTTETINGRLYTVVWYEKSSPYDDGFPFDRMYCRDGSFVFFDESGEESLHIATALPALPRHPKLEDAPLLYRYMAEGFEIHLRQRVGDSEYFRSGYFDGFRVVEHGICMFFITRDGYDKCFLQLICSQDDMDVEITHCTHNGENVEVAIEEA